MLTDEQVLPTLFYWAKRLCTRDVPFNELVNEAYVTVKKLKSPLLLQKWVKWTMIHYRIQRKQLIPDLIVVDVEDTSFDFDEFKELQQELLSVVDEVCDEKEKKSLYAIFWHGMTYRELGKQLKVSKQEVNRKMHQTLLKLRREYERRTKNPT